MWDHSGLGISDTWHFLMMFGGFCRHSLRPKSLAIPLQGHRKWLHLLSQPMRQLNRARPPPPAPCRDYPCPTSEALWRISFFFSLSLSVASSRQKKIDWGNRALGGRGLVWNGTRRQMHTGEKKMSSIIVSQWCPFLVVCVGVQIFFLRILTNLSFLLERKRNQCGINWKRKSKKKLLSLLSSSCYYCPYWYLKTFVFKLFCDKDINARSAWTWSVSDSPS